MIDEIKTMPDKHGRRLGYEELVGRSDLQTVEGIDVHIASLEDVIASEEFTDRPKDREALRELRQLPTQRNLPGLPWSSLTP